MFDIKIRSRVNNLGYHFDVEVSDENGVSNHRITMDRDFVMRIGANYDPEEVVRKSFEFLLNRESKEKILEEFDLTVISKLFPDYIPSLEKMLRENYSADA